MPSIRLRLESEKKEMRNGRVVGFLFLVVGIVIIIGWFYLRSNNKSFYERAKETTAVITDVQKERVYNSSRGKYEMKYNVYVSYVTLEEQHVDDIYLDVYKSGMKKGQEVTIWYDPNNPEDVRTKEGSMGTSIVMVVVGIGFSLLGGLFAFGKSLPREID